MKLVLLPGMDGTGNLFSPLLQDLEEFDCQIISLPTTGSQDYVSITGIVREQLPKENFILVAESFSGPIGAALAKEGIENLKGIIFVASFLSAPNKLLLIITKCLPLKILSNMPLSSYFHKSLFLGFDVSNELLEVFRSTINTLHSSAIKARMRAMSLLSYSPESIDLPAVYIQAASDKLVSSKKVVEFSNSFNNIIIKKVEGPHFILQAQPAICAAVIAKMASLLSGSETTDALKALS